MQNFLRAYACKKLVRTANYGFASKWSGGEAVWIPGRKGGGRRGGKGRRQYFFAEFQILPPETLGVPPLARATVTSGTARKAAGDRQAAAPGGLPLLFVRVPTHRSPQTQNLSLFQLGIFFVMSHVFISRTYDFAGIYQFFYPMG